MSTTPTRRRPAPLDLDTFALDDTDLADPGPAPTSPRGRPRGPFLAGPLSWAQLDRAARLPGRALHLWLILKHRARLCRSKAGTVSVCLKRVGSGHGLNESAARRALRALEGAGLVTVARRPGRALEVTLQAPPPEGS